MEFFTDFKTVKKDSDTTMDIEKAKSILFRLKNEEKMLTGYKYYLVSAFPLIISQLKPKEVNAYNNFVELIKEYNKLIKQFDIRLNKIRNEVFFSNMTKRETEIKLKTSYEPDFKELAVKQKKNIEIFVKPAFTFAKELNEVLQGCYHQEIPEVERVISKLKELLEASKADGVIVHDTTPFRNISKISNKENYFSLPLTNEERAKTEPFPLLYNSERGRLLNELKNKKGFGYYEGYLFNRYLEKEAEKLNMAIEQYKDYYVYNEIDKNSVATAENTYYDRVGKRQLESKLYSDYVSDKINSYLDKTKELHYLLEPMTSFEMTP